jgi:hypothetical protein
MRFKKFPIADVRSGTWESGAVWGGMSGGCVRQNQPPQDAPDRLHSTKLLNIPHAGLPIG